MTRENKLALVVGFGLILLVGILISDHFSTARLEEPAVLNEVATDPLNPTRWDDPELIALTEPGSRPIERPTSDPSERDRRHEIRDDPSDHRADDDAPRAPRRRADRADRTTPPPPDTPQIQLAPEERDALPYRKHRVGKGEYFSTICKQYYGDLSLMPELARYNGIDDPDAIVLGTTIKIPDADVLVRGGTPAAASARPPRAPRRSETPERNEPVTYTVRKNDNLSKIAKQLLGDTNKARLIFDRNRSILNDPDELRPGMVLTIPSDG